MDAALVDQVAQERAQAPSDEWGFEEGAEIYPGRYALMLLGGGRRYEAYLAFDEELLATVVVKILRPSRARDERALQGLASELRALQALNHPVIARGFGGVLKGARPHICVEFLEGPRLSTLIRKFGPLPVEQFIPLAVQLCSALHYMHARRMVHLDVKPKNIIMGAPPRLIDLSIARTFRDAAALDVAVGTDAYMAPEQCVPTPGHVGAPADIWGLGVTLHEAVTGEIPFPRGSHDDRHPQIKLAPQPLDGRAPGAIADLVDRCLRRDPRERPTARDLNDRLEPLVAALPHRVVLNRFRPRWR
jgi:serine/threonine-protein kinase